jgi:hypothetical protein
MIIAAVACLGTGLAGFGLAAAGAQVTDAPPQQLASGLTDVTLGGLAVARDGTGGLTYTVTSGGISHVYFSRLLNGTFGTPVQLDSGVLASASDPVVTADNGGQVIVAFISGGNLYAAEALASGASLSTPQMLASNASSPSVSMNLYGIAYLAYSAVDGGGDDVDVQYFDGSGWSLASPPSMNNTPGDVAGIGTDAPSVVAASDGVGIVAWGEGGHVYSRRVSGTATSVEVEQDDVSSYGGLAEQSATDPRVASGGDSTYPDIVFTETFQDGSGTVTRAMLTRLVAEDTRSAVAIDGISGTSENGIQPAVAMGEVGRGLITAVTGLPASAASTGTTTTATTTTETTTTGTTTGSTTTGSTTTGSTTTATTTTATTTTATTTTGSTTTATTTTDTTIGPITTQNTTAPFGVAATILGENGAAGTPAARAAGGASDPSATPGVFGSTSSGLVWDQDDGTGLSEILLSYAANGVDLSAPVALSSALSGPIQSAGGLLLAGDGRGDAAAAWVQGTPGALSVDTGQLYTPEGEPGLRPADIYTDASQPVLAWNVSGEDWGQVNYAVTLRGTPVAETTATSLTLPSGLTDGTYPWNVTASNAVGDLVSSGAGKLVIDTFAPRLRLRLAGTPTVKATQHLSVSDTDPANPTQTGATASGVKSVSLSWGDGSKTQTAKHLTKATHAYAKAGLYRLVVTVTDEVGNATSLTRLVRVLP